MPTKLLTSPVSAVAVTAFAVPTVSRGHFVTQGVSRPRALPAPEYGSCTLPILWAPYMALGADPIPQPTTSNESVVAKTRTVDDLTVKDLTLPVSRTTPRCLLFSEDGKAFYHLDKNN